MIERTMVYDILYALLASDGRVDTLFGDCDLLAHAAFERSCPGRGFPELWFELPLAGDPWFDLHVLTSREDLDPDMRFEAATTGGYPEVFSWFAKATGVRQLALSYDLHAGDIGHPPVQLLARDPRMHEPFLALAGGEGAVAAFCAFRDRLPEGWFPAYTGVFAARKSMGARVECIPRPDLQRAYVEDASLMAAHLRQAGRTDVNEGMLSWCQRLAAEPLQLEFQFDLLADGELGPTFSASARIEAPVSNNGHVAFAPGGPEHEIMEDLERGGLVDGRWRELPQTAFAKRIARDSNAITAFCYPAFLKLRWRSGELADAKTYLIAGTLTTTGEGVANP